jgi:FKBP-type peptidyl-prolyl cis-trans isomerase SlyD
MKATQDAVVSIRYTLTVDGQVLDQGDLDYLHGHGNIIQGLEEALEGKQAGDSMNVVVPPEKAYGERNEEGVMVVPLHAFPQDSEVQPGMQFYAEGQDGRPLPITVLEVNGDEVTVDSNHPLAGETLNFAVEVTGVRPASREELDHGHVHGPGEHHH